MTNQIIKQARNPQELAQRELIEIELREAVASVRSNNFEQAALEIQSALMHLVAVVATNAQL